MRQLARAAAGVALTLTAVGLLGGCSSDSPAPARTTEAVAPVAVPASGGPAAAAAAAAGATTATTAVSRWWGNSAASAGSTVDVANPGSVAAKLHPSRTEYCGMLQQTVAAGHSVLSGVAVSDPKFAAATTAFIEELEHVAPSEVAQSWQVLGGVIISIVSGHTGGSQADASTIKSAAATVSADAQTRCGISLSRAG